MSETPKYPDARPEMQELYKKSWEALCGTAANADTSTNTAILPTVKNASPSGEVLLPDTEWNSLSLESQHKLHTWFRLATERLQAILDEPEKRTPGEDAWLDEMEQAIQMPLPGRARDKLRIILRAYRANLLTQAARDTNDLCEAISRIRWARGTDKLDAAIFEAIRIQSIVDASKQRP